MTIPKPAQITWGYEIQMPPDGGRGGLTVFAALNAAYYQFGFVDGPNPIVISGRGDADPQGPMASMVNPYRVHISAWWNAGPTGHGNTPPSALGPPEIVDTPPFIDPAHPQWRPYCIMIGAEDNPEGKAVFDGYTNLTLFICFNPGPGSPTIRPDYVRPADRLM